MNKAVIFDVDGTLWDAVSVITESWNITAKKHGITTVIKEEDMRPLMGKPMKDFAVLFPELPQNEAVELLDICCREEIDYINEGHAGDLYDGMREIIEKLSEEYDLYIVSNCQVGYIESLLNSCNLNEYFEDFENYGRTGKSKGRNIRILMERCDIDKAIYIGDTVTDMEACMEAEIPFILADYGMGEVEYSRFVAKNPVDIPDVIKSMKYFSL